MKRSFLQIAVLAVVAGSLLSCATSPEDDGQVTPALTLAELKNPEKCKDCHPKHYEQWSASMHAYASDDPVFLAMNKRGQEETGGTMREFCVNCHAPMAVKDNMITDFANPSALPTEYKGVTCYFCHNAVDVGDKHVNGMVNLANDDVMRAAVSNPVEPTTHKVAYSSLHDRKSHDSSTLCGTCHDIENALGVRLERTFEEYSNSIFASDTSSFQSCQTCHMQRTPGGNQQIAAKTGRSGDNVLARELHEHLWPAVDVALTDWPHADAMRSAVANCVLPNAMSAFVTIERQEGPLGQLIVLMEADAGHNFPSGATQDRRLWLELIAYDESMTELYRIGQVADGALEETEEQPHPCMFRDRIVDQNGKETHDFWEAAKVSESFLMPVTQKGSAIVPGGHTAMCPPIRPPLAFAQKPAAFIDMRLRMRPMGMDVLSDLVSTGHLAADVPARMPTFTVFSRRATYIPESRSYGISPLNDEPELGDCRSYLCLLDPQSQECLAN